MSPESVRVEEGQFKPAQTTQKAVRTHPTGQGVVLLSWGITLDLTTLLRFKVLRARMESARREHDQSHYGCGLTATTLSPANALATKSLC